MQTTLPAKLRAGDQVRVVAPSLSRAYVLEHDHSALIGERFAAMGLRLTYGAHVDERDAFDSSSIASRVQDLHEAFADPAVRGVLTVIGGFNSNELLPHLDFDLVGAHPKVFCGFSDITALQCAILARTGLVTYSGPHWSTFGMRDHLGPTTEWFRTALFDSEPFDVEPSPQWTDDPWFLDQDHREPLPNPGLWPIQPGEAEGRVVGTNLCTLNLLQGTSWMPSLDGALLVLEDDATSTVADFARNLTSLLQLPDAAGVRGLVVGRFQRRTGMTRELLTEIVARQPALTGRPVLAGVDVGHTMPLATVAIGGTAHVRVGDPSRLRMIRF
jgi:muramoyltetrapeptide carboxypeptidase LdcA involved in peptidoglycan recycling